MTNFWRWLLRGSDDLVMPRTWLKGPFLASAEAWTRSQLDQGSIVKDVAAKRREAFWARIEAKQAKRPSKSLQFPRRTA